VSVNQPLVELMTDKVNVEIPSEIAGTLTHQYAKEGDVVPVGTRIASIDDGRDGDGTEKKPSEVRTAPVPPKADKKPAEAAPAAAAPKRAPAEIKATAAIGKGKMSPKVKMMIREYSIDPATITPTGKQGRVTVDDVQRAVDAPAAAGPPVQEAVPQVIVEIPQFPPLPQNEREERQPLQGVRKLISDHMSRSLATSAHVTTFEDIDMTELAAYRREIKPLFKETYGANITFMPFIIKAACLGMKEFPKLNASMTGKEIIYKKFYNVGVAVARDEGLIVPVIRDADKKTIVELAVELAQIGEKARKNQLTPDDVADGTFTVTNAGMFGATASTPIISQPQVAILGVHAIVRRPWVIEDDIVIRDISTFGLSFDHRLIDGHTAVQFLHRIHEYLADARRMVLNLR
jgi:2-oxoglutarate dehydrogenase E2 component (dihydrolipoamide succinyltransferase)